VLGRRPFDLSSWGRWLEHQHCKALDDVCNGRDDLERAQAGGAVAPHVLNLLSVAGGTAARGLVVSFGPWRRDISTDDRLLRIRLMRSIAQAHAPSQRRFINALYSAERGDYAALARARELLDEIPPLFRRHVLASYQAQEFRPPQPQPSRDRVLSKPARRRPSRVTSRVT
jgi:hypothetical protein